MTVLRDWRQAIVRMVHIKQEIAEADREGLWEFHLPKVGATAEHVARAEEMLGFRLNAQYRDFLRYADGWPSFFQTVDLFGADDLAGGPRSGVARDMLAAVEPFVLEQSGLSKHRIVPIAASVVDLDLFVTTVVDGQQGSEVVWLAGDEIDRFPSFEDYVLAMIEYNASELAALTDG